MVDDEPDIRELVKEIIRGGEGCYNRKFEERTLATKPEAQSDSAEPRADGDMLNAPSAYADGYAKARTVDQEAADNYIRHTTIGDPVLDAIMEELSSMPPADLHRFIGAGLEQQEGVLREAPQILRDFIESLDEPPP